MAADLLKETVGENLVKKDGSKVASSSLCGKGKVIGLYFSAHWCPPCRGFTPLLEKLYEKVRSNNHQFEVIFVSCDRDLGSFKDYFRTMPWTAMDYEEDNPDPREQVMDKYGVQGIPSLIILDGATGETITTNGQNRVMTDAEGKAFPWRGIKD